jgi:hypothetical protein
MITGYVFAELRDDLDAYRYISNIYREYKYIDYSIQYINNIKKGNMNLIISIYNMRSPEAVRILEQSRKSNLNIAYFSDSIAIIPAKIRYMSESVNYIAKNRTIKFATGTGGDIIDTK